MCRLTFVSHHQPLTRVKVLIDTHFRSLLRIAEWFVMSISICFDANAVRTNHRQAEHSCDACVATSLAVKPMLLLLGEAVWNE